MGGLEGGLDLLNDAPSDDESEAMGAELDLSSTNQSLPVYHLQLDVSKGYVFGILGE